MANWWDSAPLANQNSAPAQAGNWWDSAPLAESAAPAPIAQKPGEDQTSWYERIFRGMKDVPEKGAQLIARGVETAAPLFGEEAARRGTVARQAVDARVAQGEQEYQQKRGERGGKFDPMRLVGNLPATVSIGALVPGAAATTIPRMMLSGAGAGAAAGALQPVTQDQDRFWQQTGKDAAIGAGAGALAAGAVGGISRMISPNVSPELKAMADAGVDVSPGRAVEGVTKDLEGALRDVRVGGSFARNADKRSLGQFNVASVNEALKPLGVKFDTRATTPGNELIAEAGKAVDSAYKTVAQQVTGKVDDALVTDLSVVPRMAAKMPEDVQKQFTAVVADELKAVKPGANIDGNQLVSLFRGFRDRAYDAKKAGAPTELVDAYRSIADGFEGLMRRISPEGHAGLQAANTAHRNMLSVINAGSRATEKGIFTPQQLAQGARKVGGERAAAEGRAPLQNFAQSGMEVLKDAGSYPARGDIWGLLGSPISGAIGVGTSPLYTPMGTRLITQLFTQRPSYAKALAEALRQSSPLITTGAATGIQQ